MLNVIKSICNKKSNENTSPFVEIRSNFRRSLGRSFVQFVHLFILSATLRGSLSRRHLSSGTPRKLAVRVVLYAVLLLLAVVVRGEERCCGEDVGCCLVMVSAAVVFTF